MTRSTSGSGVGRLAKEAGFLRNRAVEVVAKIEDTLESARPAFPDELDDRAQDVVEPLLAIADTAGGTWPERVRRAVVDCEAKARARPTSRSGSVCSATAGARSTRRRRPPGHGEPHPAPVTGSRIPLGGLQRPRAYQPGSARPGSCVPTGFGPRTIRLDEKTTLRGYHRSQFEESWARYLARARRGKPSVATVPQATSRRIGGRGRAQRQPWRCGARRAGKGRWHRGCGGCFGATLVGRRASDRRSRGRAASTEARRHRRGTDMTTKPERPQWTGC